MGLSGLPEKLQHGFEGFLTVSHLQRSSCAEVPRVQGVYLVVRQTESEPHFLDQSIGGHFEGRDPTVPIIELRHKWVPGANVIYIGRAGGRNSEATLHSRLRSYMRFGQGKPVGHRGGRYVWQLADSAELLVGWRPTPQEEPADAEAELIQEFKTVYGRLPFANLVEPALTMIG